jgi:cysteine synthase
LYRYNKIMQVGSDDAIEMAKLLALQEGLMVRAGAGRGRES